VRTGRGFSETVHLTHSVVLLVAVFICRRTAVKRVRRRWLCSDVSKTILQDQASRTTTLGLGPCVRDRDSAKRPPLTHSVDVLGSCSWFRDASRPLLGGLGLAEINGLGYITANL